MTQDTAHHLLMRIGQARLADGAMLRRLNNKAVPTGLAMPYEAFHDIDSDAEHLGVATGGWGGDCWVVWAVVASDGARTLGSISVSVADFDLLGRAEVSDEDAKMFRDAFREATRRAAGEAEQIVRERIRGSGHANARR